jgi:hypothetical protein
MIDSGTVGDKFLILSVLSSGIYGSVVGRDPDIFKEHTASVFYTEDGDNM